MPYFCTALVAVFLCAGSAGSTAQTVYLMPESVASECKRLIGVAGNYSAGCSRNGVTILPLPGEHGRWA